MIPMPFKSVRKFIQLESSAGVVLFVAVILALFISNTHFCTFYNAFFDTPIAVSVGHFKIQKSLLLWINEGLMSIFFLLVGLEIKRELLSGELNTLKKACMPAIAAVGGMAFPALFYVLFNHHSAIALKGWAVPTATDTAFALGILSLFGSRIPRNLKTFLVALAIFDDIGAVIIIAIFYVARISSVMLLLAAVLVAILFLLNCLNVMRVSVYCFVGLLLWLCVLKSGVHATLAGLILALAIPLTHPHNPARSPLMWLENKLHPWVAYAILPVFAFANAGISFSGMGMSDWFGSIPLGIAAGLFFGKQIGIMSLLGLSVRLKVGELPHKVSWMQCYGMSLIAGVGFTMSLFIGTLAFHDVEPYAAWIRMGVLLGSFLSGLLGYAVLHFATKRAHRLE